MSANRVSKNRKEKPVWASSDKEEALSALWFLVAFVALGAGCHVAVVTIFIVKAISDFIFSIWSGIKEVRKEILEEDDE
jgi:hypothetical protein